MENSRHQHPCLMPAVYHHIFEKLPMIPVGAYVTYLALGVRFDLPASWQLQLSVCELVEENHQVPVVLVAFEVPGVAAHLQDHVFHTAAAGEHPVGRLKREQWHGWFLERHSYQCCGVTAASSLSLFLPSDGLYHLRSSLYCCPS